VTDLDSYLTNLRGQKKTYNEGLALAKQFVIDRGGEISLTSDGITTLKMQGEEAHCFLPYSDIDLFYFET
jgi:hypothetical protein